MVDDDNDTVPENFNHFRDVLPAPETLNFIIQEIDPWHQSGKFPVGKENINTLSNISVHYMWRLDFFYHFHFMKYIKDVVIPENNKPLNSPMVLSEYFRKIGCCLIMAFYFEHSARDLFLKDLVTLKRGPPARLGNRTFPKNGKQRAFKIPKI